MSPLARRLGMLVVVGAILLGARLVARRTVEVGLSLDYGPAAPSVREAALIFTDEHERVARDLRLRYPSGAPATDQRAIHLRQGRYTVGARLTFAAAPERTFSRPLVIDGDGTYSIDLR